MKVFLCFQQMLIWALTKVKQNTEGKKQEATGKRKRKLKTGKNHEEERADEWRRWDLKKSGNNGNRESEREWVGFEKD